VTLPLRHESLLELILANPRVNGDVLSIALTNNVGSRIMSIKGVEITGNIIPRYTNLDNPSFTDI
jgi:hypothetical protein